MINKVTNLSNLGPFTGIVWPDAGFEFKAINLLYGFNGSGKTMLSSVIRIFGEDLSDEDKAEIIRRLHNDNIRDPDIELWFDGKKVTSYSDSKKILVFNTHFVSEHVYDGSNARVKKFKGGIVTAEHLKNPQIKKLEEQILEKQKQQAENDEELTQLLQLASSIRTTLSNKWNKFITDHRLPQNLNLDNEESVPNQVSSATIELLEKELEEHFRKFKVSKSNHDIQRDIDALEEFIFDDLNFDIDLKALLTKIISQDAFKKIETKLKQFKQINLAHSSIQDWFEDGATLLEKSKKRKICPLCDSSIPNISELISDYTQYFNEEFVALQEDLKKATKLLDTLTTSATNTNSHLIIYRKIISKYQLRNKLTEEQQSLIDGFSISKIESVITIAKTFVSKKQRELGMRFSDKDLQIVKELSTEFDSYNSSIKDLEEIRILVQAELIEGSFNLEASKSTAKNLFWKQFDNEGQDRVKKYLNKGTGTIRESLGIPFYRSLLKEKRGLLGDLTKLSSEKLELLSKLKKESEFVNSFLTQLCISNFTIRIPEADDEEMDVIYKGGITKKGLRYSLSESEKTALAFAYFLSKIRYEIIENTRSQLCDYIVVIDDPVSSLDENRLFSTAMLIKKMFVKDTEQLFVFSHNLVFLKFMGNILEKEDNDKREDCYLENGQITRLPKSLHNYQTSYFYKIQKLQEYLDGKINYESAKDFIPNCIRIVLETFLSFKLCRLKQGSGSGHKYKSAGLDKLILSIDGLNLSGFVAVSDISNKADLVNALWSIKNKVDAESHGTPQDVTEFEFLSEAELKNISQSTLDAIAFLDQIHFQQITSA